MATFLTRFTVDVSEETIHSVVSRARDYASLRGILVRAENSTILSHHAPFTLFPSLFPKNLFLQAKDIQKDFNLLIHKVSLDYEFLKTSLARSVVFIFFAACIWYVLKSSLN